MDITALAERIESSFPTLSGRGRRVALAVHRILALGRPVPDYAVAAATGLQIVEVREEMADWPGVYRNDPGRIIGYWGLALGETAHEFEVDGRTLYTWCAWDALFLPELIGQHATVRSPSAVTGDAITLEVSSDRVTSSNSEVCVSFVDPELCDVEGDQVISSFCHHIMFLSSREEGEAWVAQKGDGTYLLSLQEAFELGRACNALRYGSALVNEGAAAWSEAGSAPLK